MQLKRLISVCALVTCLSAAAMTANAAAAALTGAGSTLVAPLVNIWASKWNGGGQVSYGAVGSGQGITEIENNQVDFGASDAPLLSAAGNCDGGNCKLIPWALTATGVGYNVPGVSSGLNLSPSVIAGIYLGQITNWSAPQIKALNRTAHLPNLTIVPVSRLDGSGDTYVFENFLAHAVGAKWTGPIGAPSTVNSISAGVKKKGNSGIALEVTSQSGAIGYMSASYLIQQKITVARVQNAAGNFEYPNLANIVNAATSVKSVPGNISTNGISIQYPSKAYKIAYPISTFSYAIVPHSPPKASLLKSWFTYALTTGRSAGLGIDFAAIPSVVQKAALATVNSL